MIHADLSDPGQIRQAVDDLKNKHGRLDVLVNNAGIELDKSFDQVSTCEWDRILNVNLRGAFLLAQTSLPLFPQSGGAIINIGSIHATHAFPDSIPYACSKAGLLALTRNLALELAPRKIRVNAICPGYIDTRLWEDYLRHAANPEALAAQTTALHPVGRRGLPADIAEAANALETGDYELAVQSLAAHRPATVPLSHPMGEGSGVRATRERGEGRGEGGHFGSRYFHEPPNPRLGVRSPEASRGL